MDEQPVDAGALRRWAGAALAVLGRSREQIDALNVFPIADSDTGTNMYLTFEAAYRALDDRMNLPGPPPAVPEALQALAHGALLGARGNSGVILSQLLRGAAGARYTGSAVDGGALATGLAAAAELAYEAVARPVEGTILSVATAAAEAASAAASSMAALAADRSANPDRPATRVNSQTSELPASDIPVDIPAPRLLSASDSLAFVAQAAAAGAREALGRTPDQLDVLRRAGVVDAGGLGLVIILETLAAYTGGSDPRSGFRQRRLSGARGFAIDSVADSAAESVVADHGPASAASAASAAEPPPVDPTYEVIYLLDAPAAAVTGPGGLRAVLDEFCEAGGGDSLVVVGGGELWRVHVHVDDPGVPIEAGIAAGRPYDIKITHFGGQPAEESDAARAADRDDPSAAPPSRPTRAVVAVAYGPGIGALFEDAGAQVLLASADRPPSAADFERAILATGAAEVVLLANDAETTPVAAAVAERFGGEWADGGRTRRPAGARPVRVSAVPAKVTVQGIAALAVHEPNRRFDADVVAMTAAAGATRYGAVEVAATEAWTTAGVCRAGQALGHVENDVALIEDDQVAAACAVLERMLSAGGEMVTMVVGAAADPGMPDAVAGYLHDRHPVVDVLVYQGGQTDYPLLIGVE